VAISGEKATFHAGGEYPYPVPQDNNVVSLEYRKYGVELTFTPIVQDNGMIRLEVEPKVSQLDFTNSLRVSGFTVPGLIIRQTKTTVELRSNESLSVGGLFQPCSAPAAGSRLRRSWWSSSPRGSAPRKTRPTPPPPTARLARSPRPRSSSSTASRWTSR